MPKVKINPIPQIRGQITDKFDLYVPVDIDEIVLAVCGGYGIWNGYSLPKLGVQSCKREIWLRPLFKLCANQADGRVFKREISTDLRNLRDIFVGIDEISTALSKEINIDGEKRPIWPGLVNLASLIAQFKPPYAKALEDLFPRPQRDLHQKYGYTDYRLPHGARAYCRRKSLSP
jgi:hypothetical protein